MGLRRTAKQLLRIDGELAQHGLRRTIARMFRQVLAQRLFAFRVMTMLQLVDNRRKRRISPPGAGNSRRARG